MISNAFPWTDKWLKDLLARLASMPHAILLHGLPGIGKLALAESLARYLLCETPIAGNAACGRCTSCKWMAAGTHPDFRRLEPEALAVAASVEPEAEDAPARRGKPSNEIKIEQVRELADFLNIGSHRGARRVVLVHPAEAMNPNAANALLKGLEEPPPGVQFLLVAHQAARLLATIRSRCIAYAVPVPGRRESADWLSSQGTRDAARWLAFEGGAPVRARDAAAGDRAALIQRLLEAAKRGDRDALGAVDDRDQLEALAEVLQKVALDKALRGLCGSDKYGCGDVRLGDSGARPEAWLAFARQMGQDRLLARHPVNPRLFAAAMLTGLPGPGLI